REVSNANVLGNHVRRAPGCEAEVAGAYNSVFTSQRPTGRRTAMIIDPPRREDSSADAGSEKEAGNATRIRAGPDAKHRGLQGQVAGLRKWDVWTAVAQTRGDAPVLSDQQCESRRRSRGPKPGRTGHGRRSAPVSWWFYRHLYPR